MRNPRPDILERLTPEQQKRWYELQEARRELERRIPRAEARKLDMVPYASAMQEWDTIVDELGALIVDTRENGGCNRNINNTSRYIGLKLLEAAVESLKGGGYTKESLGGRNARDEAAAFLFGSTFAWRNSRRAWCEIAGMTSARLEKRAIELQGAQR